MPKRSDAGCSGGMVELPTEDSGGIDVELAVEVLGVGCRIRTASLGGVLPGSWVCGQHLAAAKAVIALRRMKTQ